MEISHFKVGDPPLDPSVLNADVLGQMKALPPAAEEARHYDDSDHFEEAGGGTVTDRTGPLLGGRGGFSVKGLGPGGPGGVGVGVGLGKNPGSGGPGEGFAGRGKGHRDAILGGQGGTKIGERAVGGGLNWLARHQATNGQWSLDFRRQCKGGVCSGASSIRANTAATAMALLPFFGAGQTHKSKGPYQATISKGIAWLLSRQSADGNLADGADKPMYAHGLATILLCEAYGMTRDERLGYAAREAVMFIERAQNQESGGWRYVPGSYGDTSVFGWQVMALKSAQMAGLPISTSALDKAQKWLQIVATGPYSGLYRYQPSREATPTMTAVGMLCRQYMGVGPKDPGMLEGKSYLLQNMPDTGPLRDCYYWYYATLVMHNFLDADWDTWNRKMRRVLIDSQAHENEGCAEGSWDPDRPTIDAWGGQGGRLMMTSFNTLTLEVYYRYLPLFNTDLSPLEAAAKADDGPVESKTEQ